VRNINERRPEIALYLAIGFNRKFVSRLLAIEYLLILLAGIFIGAFSAFIGLLPSIFRAGTTLPWSYIIVILFIVLSSGLLCIFFPIKSSIKKNIIHSLQSE